jgi:hypothetical protein
VLIHTNSICNNALHDLTLIKMTVTHFVGTGGFLIRYSKGCMEETYCQLKKFLDYF